MRPTLESGTYDGTGAAITLELGFVPAYLEVINNTDGDVIFKWTPSMAAGTCITVAAAVAPVSANGVTAFEGTEGGQTKGVVLGTALSESGKTFSYIAHR